MMAHTKTVAAIKDSTKANSLTVLKNVVQTNAAFMALDITQRRVPITIADQVMKLTEANSLLVGIILEFMEEEAK